MINKKDFEEMRKELDSDDNLREKQIEISREVIKQSKLIIYAVQRDNLNEAEKKISAIKTLLGKLPDNSYETEMVTSAKQEYVEAVVFYHYVKDGKLVTRKELHVSSYEYLLGLCDLTGELMRKAINYVINDNFKEAEKIRTFVDALYHEFMEFNLRNGELRKKSDQIKWNLEKLDNVMYDIKIKRG